MSGYEGMLCRPALRELGLNFDDQAATFDVAGIRFTLLTASDENSPVGRFLKRRGDGIFMVSMEVENARREAERLRAKGKRLVFEKNIEGNIGATNFIHPKDMNGFYLSYFSLLGFIKEKNRGNFQASPSYLDPNQMG